MSWSKGQALCLFLLVLAFGLGFALMGCSRGAPSDASSPPETVARPSPSQAASRLKSQVRAGGGVTIEVQPLSLGSDQPTQVKVSMNTHSVDLSFDLTRLVVLRLEGGDPLEPTTWQGPREGHHVEGLLFFPPLELGSARRIEIVVRAVTGSEEVFQWDLGTP